VGRTLLSVAVDASLAVVLDFKVLVIPSEVRSPLFAATTLRIFDPACGCGNFLVIAYRELRLLEIEVLKLLRRDQQLKMAAVYSRVDVDQFYGIEISEFPARISEVALWMMDHIMNNALSAEFGNPYLRIPLKKSPHIHPVDALEIDWAAILPPDQCSYVLGNPPFGGAKYQTDKQREQVRRVARLGGSGGTLDYVTAWFIKAGEYISSAHVETAAPGRPVERSSTATPPRIGFVGTNSITQGEQVAQLWPVLFGRYGLEISFAHRTFAWGSDARGKAHVHVVIIGLCRRDDEPPQNASSPTTTSKPTPPKAATLRSRRICSTAAASRIAIWWSKKRQTNSAASRN